MFMGMEEEDDMVLGGSTPSGRGPYFALLAAFLVVAVTHIYFTARDR